VKDITKENIRRAFKEASHNTQIDIMNTLIEYNLNLDDIVDIRQGQIAKMFGQGGGTQIQFKTSLSIYEDLGLLREVVR
jgi:hypothetical protein